MLKFKKPITEFTFQDAEYITVKISDLLRDFYKLLSSFVNGAKNGGIYRFGEDDPE